jgi:hypothetical protein
MELTDIFRTINASIDSVPKEVGTGSDPVTSNDRAARVHHLINYKTPWLETRWYDENIAKVEKSRQFRLVLESKELD